MTDMRCPYCEAECEVCHDDGAGYAEEVRHVHECHECDKVFVFETVITFEYHPYPTECLSDGSHEWEPSFTFPIEHTRGVCKHCHTERKATPEDMAAAFAYRAELASRAKLNGKDSHP
ncbi:hypothetical protein PL335_06190 [Sulfitobacter faviae]|uniref:hypothetical protein n=1 Tax=Sulfitobacter faviae TaxID=1775881 RepID=UPI0023080CD9|nr:hypothetical protein [Sulfitobacter faviae]WCE67932.1 hypothetical protein PL335_06190 [Sulfitobacter faviae]